MILHTDFRDYYDHAVGYGVDEKVHYNRFTTEAEILVKARHDFPRNRDEGLLGFCGKIYPFIEFKKFNRKYDDDDWGEIKVIERYYAFNYEEFKAKEFEWRDYTSWKYSYVDHSREVKFKQFFIEWHYESDEVFLEHKAPVWTVKLDPGYRNKGLLNPKLKDFGFDRLKDALTAFQDISMYVANVLVEQKETAAVEDKFRIEQHGFDTKKSFRKEKKS